MKSRFAAFAVPTDQTAFPGIERMFRSARANLSTNILPAASLCLGRCRAERAMRVSKPFDQTSVDEHAVKAARLRAVAAAIELATTALEDLFLLRERCIK